jgi:hypothetical protein
VSKIVNEYQDKIDMDLALSLRELYGFLNREGLSVAQCAIGFRIMKLFSEQGVEADSAEHFVTDIYKSCKNRVITCNIVVSHIEDLTKFSENMRLPEIEGYLIKISQNKEFDDKRAKNSELKKRSKIKKRKGSMRKWR